MKHNFGDAEMILVCVRADEPTPWKATNLFGVCSFCGVAIQFRPHAPPHATKACMRCFNERADPDKDVYLVTRRSLAEVDAERRKN